MKLPKIGWVRYRDHRPLRGKLCTATVSLAPDGWHISFGLEIAHEIPAEPRQGAVGIDRGVANTITLSTGDQRSLPQDALQKLERRRKQAQKVLSRRIGAKRGEKNSKRREKARARMAKISGRIARIRKHMLHQWSLDLAREFGHVGIEKLKIKNMTRSAKGTVEEPGRNVRQKAGLNRYILHQGWGIFATQLKYKLNERGGELIPVDPAYTSQTCAQCGAVDRQSRKSQARFVCTTCGHADHADVNAAKEILRRSTASKLVEGKPSPVETRIMRGSALRNPEKSNGKKGNSVAVSG